MSEKDENKRFTIVCASCLGLYKHCARDREKKFHRAVKSVLEQTFKDFELWIVADGCEKTFELVQQYQDERIRCALIEKQPLLSGNVRNFGIHHASGEWICYIDSDDYFGKDHLQIINDEIIRLKNHDWIFFNMMVWNKKKEAFVEQPCDINRKNHHGTGNLAHKKSLNVLWKTSGYLHDYFFVKDLLNFKNYKKIITPQYYCCHIPGGGGYDI